MDNYSRNNLSVVQGDTLEVTLTLENPEELIIQEVRFVCKALDINTSFSATNTDDMWMLTIEAEQTKNYRVGTFLFDVTAVSDSGEVFTVVHNATLEVLYKYNKDGGN